MFDHTSILRLLETFFSHKTGSPIQETNISTWRRTVCGDLTSAFRPYREEAAALPLGVKRKPFFSEIHEAQYKPIPSDFGKMDEAKIAQVRKYPCSTQWLPGQESGTRPACALPYELGVEGALSADRKSFAIQFSSAASGVPFRVYAPGPVRPANNGGAGFENGRAWDYAVSAGGSLVDVYLLEDFSDGQYLLRVHGPSGFFREFRGAADDPMLTVKLLSWRDGRNLTGDAALQLSNRDPRRSLSITVEDLSYGARQRVLQLALAGSARSSTTLKIELARSFGWHDVCVRVEDAPHFAQRFAGHIETGKESFSDPRMADVKRV
jgi:phospholipase C